MVEQKCSRYLSHVFVHVIVGNVDMPVQQPENLLETIKKGIAELTKASAFKIYDGPGSCSNKKSDKSK